MKERSWWQACNAREFQDALADIASSDIKVLAAEIHDALNLVDKQLESRDDDNDWRNRAQLARSYIFEKHKIVQTFLRRSVRNSRLTKLRETASNGDMREALLGLFDWLLGKEAT